MTQLQGMVDEFHRLGAEIYGVSVDAHFALAAWVRELGLSFPLLSDLNREAMNAWDVRLDEFLGYRDVSRRAIFVIDRAGVVQLADIPPDKTMPDFDRLLETIRAMAGEPCQVVR